LEAFLIDRFHEDDWSPDIISGRLKMRYPSCPSMWICTETIYNWSRNNPELCNYLCFGRKGYRKRGAGRDLRDQIKSRVGGEERPEVVDDLEHFGD